MLIKYEFGGDDYEADPLGYYGMSISDFIKEN
jgi:hypothetical protein